jgi:hypothetical protein
MVAAGAVCGDDATVLYCPVQLASPITHSRVSTHWQLAPRQDVTTEGSRSMPAIGARSGLSQQAAPRASAVSAVSTFEGLRVACQRRHWRDLPPPEPEPVIEAPTRTQLEASGPAGGDSVSAPAGQAVVIMLLLC